MNSRILVNHKNLSEVLAACGLLILADCMSTPATKCRFTKIKTVVCDDNVLRSSAFEFEHPDWASLLKRTSALNAARADGKVALMEQGNELITLDWFDLRGFIGDKGNFAKADKLAFVKFHHAAFAILASASEDLFSLSTETTGTNYLANLSTLKKNYVDAGGVYDSADKRVYARDFLLIVALQNFRSIMTQLEHQRSVFYGLATERTPPAGLFAALTGRGACKKYKATVKEFGKDGLVLAAATEVANEETE